MKKKFSELNHKATAAQLAAERAGAMAEAEAMTLAELREAAGRTQQEVADAINVETNSPHDQP